MQEKNYTSDKTTGALYWEGLEPYSDFVSGVHPLAPRAAAAPVERHAADQRPVQLARLYAG